MILTKFVNMNAQMIK